MSEPLPPPPPCTAQTGGRRHIFRTLTQIGFKPFMASARRSEYVYLAGPEVNDAAALISLHSEGQLGAFVTIGAGPEPIFGGMVAGTRHAPLMAMTPEGPMTRDAWERAVEVLRTAHEEGSVPVVIHHDGSTQAQEVAVVLLATHCIVCGVGPSLRSLKAALNAVKLSGLLRARPEPLHLSMAEASLVRRGWFDKNAALVAGGGDGQWACFVGDKHAAASLGFMEEHGITRVVNCGAAHGLPNHFESRHPFLSYMVLHSNDMDARAKLPAQQWSAILPFLQQAEEEGARVLIHCVAGMNRSVTTCALYLVASGAFPTVREALAHIKYCRPRAAPQERYVVWAEKYLAGASAEQQKEDGEEDERGGRGRRPSRTEKRVHRLSQREERRRGRSEQGRQAEAIGAGGPAGGGGGSTLMELG